jgi:RNA-directed DNA polymerase
MLETLENGVKGGRWFSLIDKVHSSKNLEAAWQRVKANKGSAGVDGQSVEKFSCRSNEYLLELQNELKEGRYEPESIRRHWIPKPGGKERRPLGIPTVKDRVAQGALRNILEPIWERRFTEQNYGFRPGRSCKDALRHVDRKLKSGHSWVVDVDIKGYFDNIDHGILMGELKKEVADGRVLELVERYLKQNILEQLREWTPVKGTPQGAVISPLLANIYLHPVDKGMQEKGRDLVRYADDMVILCKSRDEAETALKELQMWMERLGLELHPEKTRIVNEMEPGGFEFLGYRFEGGKRWPRRKSLFNLREKIREHTKRTNGHCLDAIIKNINPILRGWYGYFKHSGRTTFPSVDGWVRMRLRSILRKRRKRKGCGRGSDHQRWPNAYFAERGLFTMTTAHAFGIQSR